MRKLRFEYVKYSYHRYGWYVDLSYYAIWCVASREDREEAHALTTPQQDFFLVQEVSFLYQNQAAIALTTSITARFDFIFCIYILR